MAKLVAIKEQITETRHTDGDSGQESGKKKAAAEKSRRRRGRQARGRGRRQAHVQERPEGLSQEAGQAREEGPAQGNAAANAPPPPPSAKAEPAKEGDLAAALTAIAAQTAGPLASKAAHWRSLAPQACGSTPMEKAKCAEWMAWCEAPPADAAQVLDAALADRSFLAAERLTLADVACYVACKQAVAGASCRNAARWLRQVQAECLRLAPKAAWPELVAVGPRTWRAARRVDDRQCTQGQAAA